MTLKESEARSMLEKENFKVSEISYRSIVENIGVGISLISPDMEILFLNKTMKEWFPDIDVLKRPICYKAFNNPPRERICVYCPTHKTLMDGEKHSAITDTPLGNGIRNYRVVSFPIKNENGKVTAAIEMVEDITEIRTIVQKKLTTIDNDLVPNTMVKG